VKDGDQHHRGSCQQAGVRPGWLAERRIHVNEHGAKFAPVSAGDGNGLDCLSCGQIDRTAWFPEPTID